MRLYTISLSILLYLLPLMLSAQEQLFGLGLTEGTVGFEASLELAQGLGLEFIELPIQWDDIEQKPEIYSNQYIDIADSFYPAQQIKVLLSINPIDTNTLRLPKDLQGLSFDNPRVIARFTKLIDYVFSRCPNLDIPAIVIGNEVDAYLQEDPQAWQEYAIFFQAINKHIKKHKASVPVGVKITVPTLLKKHIYVQSLLAQNDAIMCTYYPIKDDFTVKSPQIIEGEFQSLLQINENLPLFLLEVGYPSHVLCKSSEKQQAQFIKNLINKWNEHQQRMPLINIVWLHEISHSEKTFMQNHYQVDSDVFAAFVGSIGLRRHNSKPKPAFEQLRKSLHKD